MSHSLNVKITPLGGLGEVGKNITAIETGKDLIIIDCGCSFKNEETPGIERIYPDLSYILSKKDKVRAIIITHGHEDHIGAVSFLLEKLQDETIPLYCSDFTWALLCTKATNPIKNKRYIVSPGSKRKVSDDFSVEFIHVNHSIPGAFALAISTPQGVLLHTGDFKVDLQPSRGEVIDLVRIGQLGQKGIKLLMMDSTNAENEGFSKSEYVVTKTLENVFSAYKEKRIIISTFASNIYRLCKIIELSEKNNRKVAIIGKSVESNLAAAIKIGMCSFKPDTIVPVNEIVNYDSNRVTIISTGAQGEVSAALSRIADGIHPKIKIEHGDVVILSSHPIPGNEKMVNGIINKLYEKGAVVISDKNAEVHASGHANKEEQKLILALAKPKYYMPVHGEPQHLRASKKTGLQMGIAGKNIIITTNGVPIMLTDKGVKVCKPVPCGEIYIDGDYESELNPAVIKDRQLLMNEGIVVISAVIDAESREILSPVSVNSRGFVYMNESAKLIQDISKEARKILENELNTEEEISNVRIEVSKVLMRYISLQTGKAPIVLVMLNYA